MATGEGQFSFRGLLMGRGTGIKVLEVTGLEGRNVRRGDEPYPRADGSIPGEHRYGESLIGFRLGVAGDAATVEPTVAAIRRAFRRSVDTIHPLGFHHVGQDERFVRARSAGYGRPRTPDTEGGGWLVVPAALVAVDPIIYSAVLHSEEVPLFGSESGGIDWPINWAANWPAPVKTRLTVTNLGPEDSYPTFQIDRTSATDDFDGVELVNETTGVTYTQDSALTDGQRLTTVFGDPVTTVDVSGNDRYTEWAQPRVPLYLAEGENVLRLEISGTTPTTDIVARLSWRDAY